MKTAFIFHGTNDNPNNHWFPWVKQELEKKGYIVHVPQFPDIEEESFESWLAVLHPYMHEINNETLFIGHSLGACFALKLLSTQDIHIKATYLVGAWGEKFDEEVIEKHYQIFKKGGFTGDKSLLYNYESFVSDLGFGDIKDHCKSFCIFASNNDPYIPIEMPRFLAQELGAQLYEYPHAGHFCGRDGYTKFDELIEKIGDEDENIEK